MGSLGTVLMFAAALAMAVATSIAVATSYYLYRWRRILSVEGKLLAIPEELIARLTTVDRELKALRSVVSRTDADQKKQRSQMHQEIDKTNQIISQLFDASATMQNALDQRDGEIKRLREGYDAELVRRFVGRFIRVKQAVNDAKTYVGTDMNTIDQIDRLLDDALDECGVEEFRPKINEDFRVAPGVADNPKVIETVDTSKNFRIIDVLEPGYRFRNGAEREIILHLSRVSYRQFYFLEDSPTASTPPLHRRSTACGRSSWNAHRLRPRRTTANYLSVCRYSWGRHSRREIHLLLQSHHWKVSG